MVGAARPHRPRMVGRSGDATRLGGNRARPLSGLGKTGLHRPASRRAFRGGPVARLLGCLGCGGGRGYDAPAGGQPDLACAGLDRRAWSGRVHARADRPVRWRQARDRFCRAGVFPRSRPAMAVRGARTVDRGPGRRERCDRGRGGVRHRPSGARSRARNRSRLGPVGRRRRVQRHALVANRDDDGLVFCCPASPTRGARGPAYPGGLGAGTGGKPRPNHNADLDRGNAGRGRGRRMARHGWRRGHVGYPAPRSMAWLDPGRRSYGDQSCTRGHPPDRSARRSRSLGRPCADPCHGRRSGDSRLVWQRRDRRRKARLGGASDGDSRSGRSSGASAQTAGAFRRRRLDLE